MELSAKERSRRISEESRRLYEIEGLTFKEIAARLGISRQAVQHRMAREKDLIVGSRGRRGKKVEREALKQLIERGLIITEIMKELSITRHLLRKFLREYDLPNPSIKNRQFRTPQLGTMEIGESFEVQNAPVADVYKNMHSKAVRRGIKLTVKKIGQDKYRVTRLA